MNPSTSSRNTPTSSRSARATCRTSLSSSVPAVPSFPSYSNAAWLPLSTNSSWPRNTSSPKATTTLCFASGACAPSPIFPATPSTSRSFPLSKGAVTCPSSSIPATALANATKFFRFPLPLSPSADGLLVEVHHQPEKALSDGMQSILPTEYGTLMNEIHQLATLFHRTLN